MNLLICIGEHRKTINPLKMRHKILISLLVPFFLLQNLAAQDESLELVPRAESFFRSVYEGGNLENVDNLAGEDIVSTYPIYEQILGKKAIHGKEAYKQFVIRFNTKWKNCQVTIDETISQGDKVVLIWSFSAQSANEGGENDALGQPQNWGGITLLRFDRSGKIIEEIGEESNPGPFGRLK